MEPWYTKNIIYVPICEIYSKNRKGSWEAKAHFLSPLTDLCLTSPYIVLRTQILCSSNVSLLVKLILREKNISLNSNQTFSCCLCPSFFLPPTVDTGNGLCSFSADTLYLRDTEQLVKALLLAKRYIVHGLLHIFLNTKVQVTIAILLL